MKLWHLFAGMIILTAVPALLIVMVALDHNPQEEFYSYETGVFTPDIFILFGAWWLIFASPVLVGGAVYRLSEWLRSRR